VKQAAYGETRTAIIKKKLMKNNLSGEAAAPANPGQLSGEFVQQDDSLFATGKFSERYIAQALHEIMWRNSAP